MKQLGNLLLLVFFAIAFLANAQEGNAIIETKSVDAIPMELLTLEGIVQSVAEAPCSFTLGNSETGIQLSVQRASDGQVVQVHLGPVWAVDIWMDGILNQPVKLVVFRTEKLPEHHFIAKELTWGGQHAVFRDGYLKPFWADRFSRELW